MTPTKILLEQTVSHLQLRVFAPETLKGSTVIESVAYANGLNPKGKTVVAMRNYGAAYAKQFAIPFIDGTT